MLGQRVIPLRRVGIYVPGGTAAYPSTVLMDAIPALVAGVERVVMVTPPDKKGKINYYFPVLKQSEYALDETENLISKIYKGSVKNLVATLYENKKLSNEDMSDLKKMFELE